jgi:hypothetical protein
MPMSKWHINWQQPVSDRILNRAVVVILFVMMIWALCSGGSV